MDIEEVAAKRPEAILGAFDPQLGFQPYQARALASRSASAARRRRRPRSSSTALADAFSRPTPRSPRSTRSSSPSDGNVLALDAKMNFDDNALFRHPDIAAMRDLDEENPLEVEASKASSTTSSSTATSAASSTAPASPWRRWTSSSSTAASRRTSSTSAAAPRRSGQERVPHPDLGPEGEGDPRQHLRRHRPHRPHRARRGGRIEHWAA